MSACQADQLGEHYNAMFDKVILIGSFISLGFIIPSRMDGEELFSFYFLMSVTAFSFLFKRVRDIKFGLPAAIVVLAIVTTLAQHKPYTKMVLMNLFVGVMALKAIADRVRIKIKDIGAFGIIFASSTMLLILIQKLGVKTLHSEIYPELTGFSCMPFMLGSIFSILFPFIFATNKIFAILSAFILLPFSNSMVCAGAVIFALILLQKKHRLFIGLACFLFFFVYVIRFEMPATWPNLIDKVQRLAVWKNSFVYITNHIVGSGIGTWAHMGFVKMNGLDPYHWRWAHNEIYQHYFEQGVIGLSLLLAYLSVLFSSIRKESVLIASFSVIFILSLAHPIFHLGKLIVLIVLILAVCEARRHDLTLKTEIKL